MKKFLALMLALLMLFGCIPVFASADETTNPKTALASAVTYETTFEHPQKTTYLVGDKLDLTGAKVVYSGSDGDNYSVDLTNALATGFDNTKTGEQKITLTYTDPRQGITSTVSYIVTVVEKSVLVSIHPTKSPDKQLYTQGEDLDVTGGEITLVYNTHTETIPMTLDMVSGYNKTTLGPQKLTITYQGCTTDFVVTVKAPLRPKRIDFVEGKTPKDCYMVGDTLDLSAIVLDVYYSDGTSKQVAANDPAVTVTGFDSSKPARLEIKFEYGGSNRYYHSFVSQKQGKCGDNLTFTFDDATGTLTIEGTGAMYDYDYNSVAPWHGYSAQIKKTVLPTGITTIGSFAFSNCSNMETINLPGTLTELKEFAFCNCFNLDLPKDILPASVKTIGQYAFSDCYGITEFDIPQGVTIIDDYAFGYCTNLTKINLPDSVKVIGNGAFIACPALKTIDLPEGLQAIRSVAFQSSGLEEFTIPGTVTEIAYMAFFDTQKLTEVTFEGDAPTLQTMGDLWADPFSGWEYPSTKAVNAYYPGGNDSWTEDVRDLYGKASPEFIPANVTWIPTYGVVDKETGMDPEVDGLDKVEKDLDELLKDLPDYDPDKKNTVALVISNVPVDTSDREMKKAMEKIEAVGKEKDIDFVDITLSHLEDGKVVVHEGNTNLGSKNNHLLVITLSYNSLGKKNMVVFRYHNGKVDTLTQKPNADGEFIEVTNDTLVIHAMKFSPYAIAYDEIPVVTFQANGGSEITALEVESGSKITKPADPTKAHYIFRGWYKDEALTTPWNFGTDTVSGSLTLYAKWEALIGVTFNTNGGNEIPGAELESGSKVVKPADPTREHYIFRGWHKDESLTTAWDFDKDTVTAATTLYAKWEALIGVTFNTNGGSEIAALDVESGSKITRPADPTKDHSVFQGWYKDEELTTAWDFDKDTVTEATTLYAKWASGFVVTFDSQGGSTVASQTLLSGSKVTKPTDPTRTNYIFRGWYKGEELTTAWDFDKDTVTEDITLYASWEINMLTGVEVSPSTAKVIPGGTKTFTAKASLASGASATLRWTVTGGKDKDTKISNKGVLTVGDDETAKTLTVTATVTCGDEVETDTATVTVVPDYDIISGSGKRWAQNSTSSLVFVANGPFKKLDDVRIDDDSIGLNAAASHTSGTKVTLKASYLKTLSRGRHTITIVYEDGGEAEGYFDVQSASDSANTGDTFNPTLWLTLMAVSAGGVLLLILRKRKQA